MPDPQFLEVQRRAWEKADERHFAWQVGNPLIAATERALLAGVLPGTPISRLLEVGSGEGGNLLNLRASCGWLPRVTVGVDLFLEKARFGRRCAAPARFVCGDALALPFASGAFDVVLCRDLLHHVQDRASALRELRRVCRPGGRVLVIEPNGRNPLIALFALALRHERGQLQTSPRRLQDMAARVFGPVELEMRQPLPVSRALAHYSFGAEGLGGRRWFARLMSAWDRACARLLPRGLWAYIVLQTVGRGETGASPEAPGDV